MLSSQVFTQRGSSAIWPMKVCHSSGVRKGQRSVISEGFTRALRDPCPFAVPEQDVADNTATERSASALRLKNVEKPEQSPFRCIVSRNRLIHSAAPCKRDTIRLRLINGTSKVFFV